MRHHELIRAVGQIFRRLGRTARLRETTSDEIEEGVMMEGPESTTDRMQLDDLDAEVVEDLDVDEQADRVRGGWDTFTGTISN